MRLIRPFHRIVRLNNKRHATPRHATPRNANSSRLLSSQFSRGFFCFISSTRGFCRVLYLSMGKAALQLRAVPWRVAALDRLPTGSFPVTRIFQQTVITRNHPKTWNTIELQTCKKTRFLFDQLFQGSFYNLIDSWCRHSRCHKDSFLEILTISAWDSLALSAFLRII